MITIPPELLQAVDTVARDRSLKRSKIVRQALEEWIEQQRRHEFEALLAEGYIEQAEVLDELVAEIQLAQAQAIEASCPWYD